MILVAVLFGPKMGSVLGTTWGLLSMIRAYMQPTPFNIVFLNPVVSVLPRLIVGFLSGVLFLFFRKKFSDKVSYAVTAGIGTLINTVFVLGSIYLFASETYAEALGISETLLLGALVTVAGTNGIIEMIASVIILPLIAIPLSKVISRRNSTM